MEPLSQQPIPQLPSDQTLGEGFLRGIPEQDRAIVAKYVRDWDGNVTRKFQEYAEKLRPYEDLGDVSALEEAVALNNFLQENPVEFYRVLQETIDELREQGHIVPDLEETQPVITPPTEPTADELLRQELEELKEWRAQQDQTAQDRAEMAELDNLMQSLHNEHGDFDEDWVLLQISRNVPPVDAIKAFNQMIEERVSSFRKPSPPLVMGGNGQVPGNQVDLSKMTAKDRIAYVAATLSAANNTG